MAYTQEGPSNPPSGGPTWRNTDEGFWDHAFGSVDESVGRQFDDRPGEGIVDISGGDDLGDLLFERPAGREDRIGDTTPHESPNEGGIRADLPGPSVNDVVPGRSTMDDPQGAGNRDPSQTEPDDLTKMIRWAILAVIAVSVLPAVTQALRIGANVTE